MSKIASERVIPMPSVKDNTKIVAATKVAPDAQPLTTAQLAALVPIRDLRGRPKSEKSHNAGS